MLLALMSWRPPLRPAPLTAAVAEVPEKVVDAVALTPEMTAAMAELLSQARTAPPRNRERARDVNRLQNIVACLLIGIKNITKKKMRVSPPRYLYIESMC